MSVSPNTPYKFSSEELKTLELCNKESFYQRCLPLATIMGATAFLGVKSGNLAPNARFGAFPKVSAAVLLGYILGKISYQQTCAEKLMALPNSKLGAMLRNRRGGFMESLTLDVQEPELPPSEKFDDSVQRGIMDLDVDRPTFAGLDDSFRPSVDGLGGLTRRPDDLVPERPGSSYDELRRRNREEYMQKRTQAYRGVLSPEEVPTALRSRDSPDQPLDDPWSRPPPKPENIYGDLFEK